jgi:hypothetical protein
MEMKESIFIDEEVYDFDHEAETPQATISSIAAV